jgi:hypothetical protein
MDSVNTVLATGVMCALIAAGVMKSAGALELITEEEAKLPDDKSRDKGITRGPHIMLVSPAPTAGSIRSPIHLRIKFESRGGVTVDEDSVVISYLKDPRIDLTQRSRSSITMYEVNIENATVPVGRHAIRVDVKDVNGRPSVLEFSFTVTK